MVCKIQAPWGKVYSVTAANAKQGVDYLWEELVDATPTLVEIYTEEEFKRDCKFIDERKGNVFKYP